jgi:hypothetical protein
MATATAAAPARKRCTASCTRSPATSPASRPPRALFAGDLGKLEDAIADWPHDIREHATMLAARALRD